MRRYNNNDRCQSKETVQWQGAYLNVKFSSEHKTLLSVFIKYIQVCV